jgi:2-haloacid dehalogenase
VSAESADAALMPEVIAFDVIGTLFPLTSLEPLMVAAGGDPSMVGLWFSRLMADGCALTAARDYQPFRDVAKSSLRDVLPKAKAAARDKVLAGLAKLEVFPDAAPAMGRVVMSARVVVISNASTALTKKLLVRGRLDAFVEEIISAEEAEEWIALAVVQATSLAPLHSVDAEDPAAVGRWLARMTCSGLCV